MTSDPSGEGGANAVSERMLGIDHVAITVADLAASVDFYERLLGARVVLRHAPGGVDLAVQIVMGGVVLSIHQFGNGLRPVAERPTVGAADFCLLWDGAIDDAVALLGRHGVSVVEGPVPRHTATGRPSLSIYFRDPDGNLLELMADEWPATDYCVREGGTGLTG